MECCEVLRFGVECVRTLGYAGGVHEGGGDMVTSGWLERSVGGGGESFEGGLEIVLNA